jgi:hypothetical protein
MNLANKTFRDNKTGEIIKVIDSFENIAILENKQKMDVKRLMNTEYYTEQIDPSSFFNNQNAYNSLAEKIKSIPVDKIKDDPTSGEVQINIDGMKLPGTIAPATNESAIVMTTEEDEMAELARKYGVTNPSNDIQRQNEAFAKLLAEDEGEVQSIQVNREPLQSVTTQEVRREVPKVEDPIITMFKNVKRNKDFSITLEINNKIPRPDFIEMMEDSYNTSIIDFLASEFTQNLLSNPEVIENMIKDKIKELVYGPVETPVNPQITDSVTQLHNEKRDPLNWEKEPVLSKDLPKKTTTRKPRAKKETSK